MVSAVLEVKGLSVSFQSVLGEAKAINQLSFDIKKGEILGIVGESGCGKSLTSLAIMGLLPRSASKREGSIYFHDVDLLTRTEKEMQKIRGNEISMIFQEPMTSLNPVYTIGNQLIETIRLHQKLDKKQAYAKAIEILHLVRIPSPEERMRMYSYELSGGMRQRVMIAIALSCNPQILIADEPTTALDVTIQAEILDLLKDLRDKLAMSIIIISHDLGVISEIADKVMVMYAGRAVEYAGVEQIFSQPLHPYTQGLLRSVPAFDDKKIRLETIEGRVPNIHDMPEGCQFHARCKYGKPQCQTVEPDLYSLDDGQVKCWMHSKEWSSYEI